MSFDSMAFRRALGQFATGVTVVSLATEDGVHGMTANSFTSVSLDPPLILVCVGKSNKTHSLIQEQERFAVNILAEDQVDVSNWYAGRRDNEVSPDWNLDIAGSPVLMGAVAWLDCRLAFAYDGGDHTIYVGQVDQFDVQGGSPLLFHQGRYGALSDESA